MANNRDKLLRLMDITEYFVRLSESPDGYVEFEFEGEAYYPKEMKNDEFAFMKDAKEIRFSQAIDKDGEPNVVMGVQF